MDSVGNKRDRNKIQPTTKTRVERETDRITAETLRAICRENVIPKRMRWVVGEKIADLINDFHTSVSVANEIKVQSHAEFVERHKFQTLAIAYLKATDVKMTLALDVLQLNADYLDTWAGQYNETLKQIQGWIRKDENRYSEKFGPLKEDEKAYVDRNIPADIRESVDLIPCGSLPEPVEREQRAEQQPVGGTQQQQREQHQRGLGRP